MTVTKNNNEKIKILKTRVGIFKNVGGNIPGRNFPGGSFPDTRQKMDIFHE